jgi:hydrogenase maturation protease
MDQERPHLAVIGLGSVLMGDDAAGPYFVNLFEANYDFPPELTVLDLGTPGPELSHYLLDWEKLIVIDTVKTAGDPGELRLYRRDEIIRLKPAQRMSPHDPSLKDALLTADFVGGGPQEILLVGVIPAKVEMGTEMSAVVKEALPKIETEVLSELSRWGITPEKKAESQSDVWWSR